MTTAACPMYRTLVATVLVGVLAVAQAACASDRVDTSAHASTVGTTVTTAVLAGLQAETEGLPANRARTAESEAAADNFWRLVRAAVKRRRWAVLSQLQADGYRPMAGDPTHWYSDAAIADGRTLDPNHPEFVMVSDGRLMGVMFLAGPAADGAAPPDPPGAPTVRWHRHRWSTEVCLLRGLVVISRPTSRGCPSNSNASRVSPYMVHVWLTGSDPFSAEMQPMNDQAQHH